MLATRKASPDRSDEPREAKALPPPLNEKLAHTTIFDYGIFIPSQRYRQMTKQVMRNHPVRDTTTWTETMEQRLTTCGSDDIHHSFDEISSNAAINRLRTLKHREIDSHRDARTIQLTTVDPTVRNTTIPSPNRQDTPAADFNIWTIVRVFSRTNSLQDGDPFLGFTEVDLHNRKTRRVRCPDETPDACMVIVRRRSSSKRVTLERYTIP